MVYSRQSTNSGMQKGVGVKKKRYKVSGWIHGAEIRVEEWRWAKNGAEALKLVRMRLPKKYPNLTLYMGDLIAEEVPTNNPL